MSGTLIHLNTEQFKLLGEVAGMKPENQEETHRKQGTVYITHTQTGTPVSLGSNWGPRIRTLDHGPCHRAASQLN